MVNSKQDPDKMSEGQEDAVEGSGTLKEPERRLKNLNTPEGVAIARALASLKKFKSKVTTSLTYTQGILGNWKKELEHIRKKDPS